jgi:hypothetical protein
MKIFTKKTIKGYKVGGIILVLLIASCSAVAVGQSTNDAQIITKTFTFSTPSIQQITINNNVYDQVIMANAESTSNPGEPNLPSYGVSLLLPQGSTSVDVSVQPGHEVLLGSGYTIDPIEPQVTLEELDTTPAKGIKDSIIYSSNDLFPKTLFTVIGTYNFRGYHLLILQLHPVSYRPASGELTYYEDMTVTIQTQKTASADPLYRGLANDKQELITKVDNSDMISSYSPYHAASLSTSYSLMILTTEALKPQFTPLQEAHNAQGLKTEIKTLNNISPLPSSVTSEMIREYIRNEYITNGVNYVLIGGDADVIPAKMLWVKAGSDTDTMPADLYYGCLDGTYNFNGNNNWGEPTDGENGGDVDLIAEVYVGRAPVGNAVETSNFVQKTIAYMNTGGYTGGISLQVGEYLWGPPDYQVTFGDDSMEELINSSHANGYSTTGIPLSTFTFSKLYDHDWPGFDLNNPWGTGWPTSEIINRINQGVHFINHLGHSNTQYNMRMVPSDIDDLTNTVLPLIYSQGCYAGAFDQGESMAEAFTVKTTHAAFAAVLCARYGWGSPGSTNGANQRYHRYFWDAVYGQQITSIGMANQYSKEANLKKINGQCMRWVYYEMNLFGDPSLTFNLGSNSAPEKPATPVGSKKGTVGQQYIYSSSTTDANSDPLYYQWSFGDDTLSPWLGPYTPGEQVNVSHNWSKKGTYEVKVKARDQHLVESAWSDPLPVKMPYVPSTLHDRLVQFIENHFPRLYSLLTHS